MVHRFSRIRMVEDYATNDDALYADTPISHATLFLSRDLLCILYVVSPGVVISSGIVDASLRLASTNLTCRLNGKRLEIGRGRLQIRYDTEAEKASLLHLRQGL